MEGWVKFQDVYKWLVSESMTIIVQAHHNKKNRYIFREITHAEAKPSVNYPDYFVLYTKKRFFF
jgi:hypothetical protein